MVVGSRRTHQEEEGLEVADMATLPNAEIEMMEQGQGLATDPFSDSMTPPQCEQQVKGRQEQMMMSGGMEQSLNVNEGTEQQVNGGSVQPSEAACSCAEDGGSEQKGSPVTSRQAGKRSIQQIELLELPQHQVLDDIDMKLLKVSSCGWRVCGRV